MSIIITVVDEILPGKAFSQFPLTLSSNRMTVREIIASRVTQEVENYNKTQTGTFVGLVQPSESERMLNGFHVKPRKLIDHEAQVQVALAAFEKNGYLVLINDRQAESLDDDVLVNQNTKITFVKLVQLVGG